MGWINALTQLLNVDHAIEHILSQLTPLAAETLPLEQSLNRILADDIIANVNLPPFANSAMDGYAVLSSDLSTASRDKPTMLRVVMDIPAGYAPQSPIHAGEAARIMTGAPIPDGADAVVPVEQTDSDWSNPEGTSLPDQVQIYARVQPNDNIRPIGENIQLGQTVINKRTRIGAAEMGMLAALGCATVTVFRQPRIAILSTGDELVGVDEPLKPGQIRDVNGYTLTALVRSAGGIPIRLPIARDNLDAVRKLFRDALAHQPDMIVSSAGVSVGAADMIRTVLDELGEVRFWRINIRPGKPLAFGHVQDVPFFGLPGNPVSAMVTFAVLVRPAINYLASNHDSSKIIKAVTDEDITSDGRRSYLRVTLERSTGKPVAHLTGTQSSGALISMVLADGLLIVPEDIQLVPAGTELSVLLLRASHL